MSEDSVSMEKKNFTPPSKKLDSSRNRQVDGSGTHVDKIRSKSSQRQNFDGATVPLPKSDPAFRGSSCRTSDKKARAREPTTHQNHPNREPEVGSLQAPGSKKQNAHNLLQFVLAPRERNHQFGHHYFFGGDLKHSNGSLRPKHSKDQYLNGRCQFMVVEGTDYTSLSSDPDRLVDWNLVEQVFVRAIDECPKCPICLEAPRAAKITKCGHIYCSACLLHYFALSDGTYKSCPICFESIQIKEVKSVLAKICKDAKVGEHVEMKLMYREKDSLNVKQVLDGEKFDSLDSKIIEISKQEVYDIIERELMELRKQYLEESENPEICFVEEAIRNATSRQVACQQQVTPEFSPTNEGKSFTSESKGNNGRTKGFGSMLLGETTVAQQNAGFQFQQDEVKATDRERKESEGSHGSEKLELEDHGFYFYQATDGQNIFLHPLNVAMIRKQFGCDPSNWPAFLDLGIIEIEDGSITEEKRKRHKFLSHLSLASAVKIVEADIKSLISQEVCDEFSSQLEYREKRRMEKQRSERQKEKLYEEQEKKKKWLPPKPKIESQVDFPSCSIYRASNDSNAGSLLGSGTHVGDSGSVFDEFPIPSSSAEITGLSTSTLTSPIQTNFSFAQAAASRRAASASLPYSSKCPQSMKGMSIGQSLNPTADKGDDEYAAPEYSSVVSQQLAMAFASLDLDKEKSCADVENGSKKKGRKKGKVLFATGFGGY